MNDFGLHVFDLTEAPLRGNIAIYAKKIQGDSSAKLTAFRSPKRKTK